VMGAAPTRGAGWLGGADSHAMGGGPEVAVWRLRLGEVAAEGGGGLRLRLGVAAEGGGFGGLKAKSARLRRWGWRRGPPPLRRVEAARDLLATWVVAVRREDHRFVDTAPRSKQTEEFIDGNRAPGTKVKASNQLRPPDQHSDGRWLISPRSYLACPWEHAAQARQHHGLAFCEKQAGANSRTRRMAQPPLMPITV